MTLSPDKLERIDIFQDTQRRCHTLPMLTEAIKFSQAAQRFIGESDALLAAQPCAPQRPHIIVSQKRSFEAALALICHYEQGMFDTTTGFTLLQTQNTER